MKKFNLSFIILFFVAFFATGVHAAPVVEFDDVNQNNSHYIGITTLATEDIISGYPNNTYRPRQNITRAHTAVLFNSAIDLKAPSSMHDALKDFKDVDENHLYAAQIAAAAEAGIFSGSDGKFMPESPLTRQQMATVLVSTFDLKDNGTNPRVNMKGVGSSHQKNVKILVQHGITSQGDDFRPLEPVTRQQFATFLYRTMQTIGEMPLDMDVHFIDVGQGDSTLIQTTDGSNILIDAGTRSAGEKVVSFLREKDVGKLDVVVATHPHADHIGGLIPVLSNFTVDKFIDSGLPHTSQTYYELLSLIDRLDIPYEVPSIGQSTSFGRDFNLTVIYGDANASNINNASVSLKGEYNNVSLLLTGDAEQAAENLMINSRFNLNSTIYKAGHHGSNTSSTPAFLNNVNPEVSVLSYGENNSYGHPHSEVVNRLQRLGSDIYSTAESGNITVTTNGIAYKVYASPLKLDVPQPKPQPKPEPKPEPKPDPKPEPGVTFPLNINKATAAQLKELPGIGDTLAPRIVAYRNANGNFQSKTDIMNVSGIGQGRYDNIKNYIVVN